MAVRLKEVLKEVLLSNFLWTGKETVLNDEDRTISENYKIHVKVIRTRSLRLQKSNVESSVQIVVCFSDAVLHDDDSASAYRSFQWSFQSDESVFRNSIRR